MVSVTNHCAAALRVQNRWVNGEGEGDRDRGARKSGSHWAHCESQRAGDGAQNRTRLRLSAAASETGESIGRQSMLHPPRSSSGRHVRGPATPWPDHPIHAVMLTPRRCTVLNEQSEILLLWSDFFACCESIAMTGGRSMRVRTLCASSRHPRDLWSTRVTVHLPSEIVRCNRILVHLAACVIMHQSPSTLIPHDPMTQPLPPRSEWVRCSTAAAQHNE